MLPQSVPDLVDPDGLIQKYNVEPAGSIVRHHPYVVQHRPYFEERGIRIDRPDLTQPIYQSEHDIVHGYRIPEKGLNELWHEFIRKYPDATRSEVLAEGERLRRYFGK